MDDVYQSYFESMPCYLSVDDRSLKNKRADRRFGEIFGYQTGPYCDQIYNQSSVRC